MKCPSCGHTNPEDAAFCGKCGSSLDPVMTCSRCGRNNPVGTKFCHGCGQALVEATPAPETPPSLTPEPAATHPTSFAGARYEVKRFLGVGGKKRVYLVRDTRLDREVAFALIKTEGLDAEGLLRIRREAQAMARLGDHPHVVSVFDIGEENGTPYLVSQFMVGGDVQELIKKAEGHRVALAQVLKIANEICQALEHAHKHGIVHRDLKPGNVWLTADGTAKLGDFGLAVVKDKSRLTQEGMMVGTVSYMPPEQAMGAQVAPSADLYSLGAMLYEMVAGRPPFVGDDSVAIITQHLNTPPVAPSWHNPDLPPSLEALILRLLEKDPSKRPASASEVRAILGSIDISSRPAPTSAQTPRENPLYRRIFVGRERELKQAQAIFDQALSGQGALSMVVGEPGIGKTAVCEQLATYVALRGGRTLAGC
ncbi:zinc-ribbon domain-containing protein [bacterium]|nr:MAG: zinc-ribbon domain-containing protein [bacterium]